MKVIQIKNKPLRAIVSALALLAMVVTGVAVLGVISYGLGLLVANNVAYYQFYTNEGLLILGFGFSCLAGGLIVLFLLCVIFYVLYQGAKKLYHGPFDP